MWSRIKLFWFASSATALLFACGAPDVVADEETEQETSASRSDVRDFWRLSREANRSRLAGRYPEAVAIFEQALAIDPTHEDSLYYLGASLERSGDYQRAEAVYRRLLEVNPRSTRGLSQLASLKALVAPRSSPDFFEARRLWERAIEMNPEHSGPYIELGRLALAEDDRERALDMFHKAAGFGSAEGKLMVGFTLLLDGDREAAAERFHAVIREAEIERERAAAGERAEGDVRGAASPTGAAAARARVLLDRMNADGPKSPTDWKKVLDGAAGG